jgi:hypothetical protein
MHGRCHYKKAAFMGGGSCGILLTAQQEGGAGIASARKVAHPKRVRPDGGRLEGGLKVVRGSRNEEGGGTYYYALDKDSFKLVTVAEKAAKN